MRGDQAERISISPDELWGPPDLYEQAFEIISSMGKVDTANNNRNVHEGVYTFYEWNYLTSTKNWFMCDGGMRKQFAFWSETMMPLGERIAQAYRSGLLPHFGTSEDENAEVSFDYSVVRALQEDRSLKLREVTRLLAAPPDAAAKAKAKYLAKVRARNDARRVPEAVE